MPALGSERAMASLLLMQQISIYAHPPGGSCDLTMTARMANIRSLASCSMASTCKGWSVAVKDVGNLGCFFGAPENRPLFIYPLFKVSHFSAERDSRARRIRDNHLRLLLHGLPGWAAFVRRRGRG